LLLLFCVVLAVKGLGGKDRGQVGYRRGRFLTRWKALNPVIGKSVDFVICHRSTLDPVMAIEVDDRSHQAPARRRRDAFVDKLFAEVGLPLMRVKAQLV
jgi:very-short-patch-repair endonuclease